MTVTPTPGNQTSENHQVLKLVPPQAKLPGQLPQKPAEETSIPTPPPQKAAASPLKKWAVIGAVALGIGGISLIPMPNFVTGDAEITSREDARQLVTMRKAGRIKLHVKERDRVQAQDLLVEIESDELNNQITQSERELEQAKVNLNAAQQDLLLAQSRLQSAQNNEAVARDRKNRRLRDLNNLNNLPETIKITQQQGAITSQITGIQSEIAGIQADILGLESQYRDASQKVKDYEIPVQEGAISSRRLSEAKVERDMLAAAIQQKEEMINFKRTQIAQQQKLTQAKSTEILEVNKQIQDNIDHYEDELQQVTAQTRTAQQEVEAATVKIQSQQQLIAKLNFDLSSLKQQREDLKIYATTSGVVTTKDLDLKNNSYHNSGVEILSVIKLADLEAEVKIHPEDRYLVEEGATVNVGLQGNTDLYTATVESIDPMAQTSEQQQKPMLTVQILIGNEAEDYLLGGTGHAHIKTENLRVYQKVSHEFNKLVNIRKYFPWLTMNREPNS